jgi:hypothetical protein
VAFAAYGWFHPSKRSSLLEGMAAPAAGAFIGAICLALFGLAMHRKARG